MSLLSLEHHNFICLQIGKLQLLSLLDDIRVFPNQQPADVRKEKSPQCIVGVCIRL